MHVSFWSSLSNYIAGLELRWGPLNAGRRMRKFHKELPDVAALLYRQAECDTFASTMIFQRFRILDDFLWAQALPFVKWNQCHLDMTSSAQTRKQHKTTSFAHESHHLTTTISKRCTARVMPVSQKSSSWSESATRITCPSPGTSP